MSKGLHFVPEPQAPQAPQAPQSARLPADTDISTTSQEQVVTPVSESEARSEPPPTDVFDPYSGPNFE